MRSRAFLSLFLIAFFTVLVVAQIPIPGRGRPSRPPTLPPETGAGLPWPEGLSRGERLTGRVGAIDKDQIMVHSMDVGDVLFWVDDKTVVRVGDFRMAVTDLRVGDPVAVKLKKVKGKGPVAQEILPHPDVKERKIKGASAKPPAPETASTNTDTAVVTADSTQATGVAPVAGMPAAPSTSGTAPASAAPAIVGFPALPGGAHGVVGTVMNASGDTLEIRDRDQKTEKVLLTGVTLIKKAGTETILPGVKNGDHVAVAGDRMDNGDWIAREVQVVVPEGEQAAASTPGAPAGAAPGTASAAPARDADVGADGLARFTGKIVSYENEEAKIETPRGVRTVLVTGITDVRRMGMRRDASALKVGDSVSVVGDVLEGGIISAREVTVTKLSGS